MSDFELALIQSIRINFPATSLKVTYQQLDTGANPPPWKKKYRQVEQRVQHIKDRMSAGQVSISEYLDAIGHLIGL